MTHQLRLFYDGGCPICRREVAWLKRRDRAGNLQLEDISAAGFDSARHDLDGDEVRRVLHGVRYDGVVIKGMEAVRDAYRTVGLGWLVAATQLPGLNALSDLLYGWFARNRQTLGRLFVPKCSEGQCVVEVKGGSERR